MMRHYLTLIIAPLLVMIAGLAMTALVALVFASPTLAYSIWRVGFSASLICYCIALMMISRRRKTGW